MCDWEACTTATIGLPNPNQFSGSRKWPDSPIRYIQVYGAGVLRERFLALEGEGVTRTGQPSRQGIALFSVRIQFGEAQELDGRLRLH